MLAFYCRRWQFDISLFCDWLFHRWAPPASVAPPPGGYLRNMWEIHLALPAMKDEIGESRIAPGCYPEAIRVPSRASSPVVGSLPLPGG